MKILLRPDKGDIVLYHPPGREAESTLLFVEEAAETIVAHGRIITTVYFTDGTWGLVRQSFIEEERVVKAVLQKVPFQAWVPDNPAVEEALRKARWIISHGPAPGVEIYRVFIENWQFRRAGINLFYGKKREMRKKNGGLLDEVFWETDRDMKKRRKNP